MQQETVFVQALILITWVTLGRSLPQLRVANGFHFKDLHQSVGNDHIRYLVGGLRLLTEFCGKEFQDYQNFSDYLLWWEIG